jgi:hypothetical protein
MHKSATKCNETVGKWCKDKHGASKIIDTLETYHARRGAVGGVWALSRSDWAGHENDPNSQECGGFSRAHTIFSSKSR